MSSISEKNRTPMYYFHTAIIFLLMFGFQFIPSFNTHITQVGMAAMGIFLGMLYGWTFVEMLWPSLLGMVAISFTGIMTVQQSFLNGFGSDITLITLFVFIFAAYMEESGLNRFIANWFISRKFSIGKPWVFCCMLILSTFVLSMFTQVFAAIVIMWSIFYSISDELGFAKKSGYVNCTIMGIVVGGTMGAICLPFNPMSVIALGLMEKSTGYTVNFVTYSMSNLIICTAIIVIYCLICKFIFRPDTTPLLTTEDRFAALREHKMNKEQKMATVALFVFLMMLLLPGVLPLSWFGIGRLKALGVSGSVACVILALLIIRRKGSNGTEGIARFGTLAIKGVNWDIIILLAATIPMSNALESPEAGVLKAVEIFLAQTIEGMNPYYAIAFMAIMLGIITQFTHNAVLLIIFIPMLCPLAIKFGINPVILTVTLVFAVQSALATPGASTQAAMVFGNTTWVDKGYIAKLALCASLLILLVAVCIVMPLATIIY